MANHEPDAGPKTSDTGRAAPPRMTDATGAARRAMDGGRAATEESAAIMQGAAKSSLDAASDVMERSTDEFKQSLDQWTHQGEDLARRSRQNLAAVADCGSVAMQGVQDITRAWIDLAQARTQRRVESLGAFARCKTPADFITAQSGLLRDSLAQMVDTNRRVAEVSFHVMQETADKMTSTVRSVAA